MRRTASEADKKHAPPERVKQAVKYGSIDNQIVRRTGKKGSDIMDYSKLPNMTDSELKEIRSNMPKYLNDMTPEQQSISQAVYDEQKKRFDLKKADDTAGYNQEVEKAGYKVGDKVSYFARSMIGFGGLTVTGKVGKRKKYFVSLDQAFNGKKTAHLTNAWKII